MVESRSIIIRAALAVSTAALAVALLFGFRTPDELAAAVGDGSSGGTGPRIAAAGGSPAGQGTGATSTGSTRSGSTSTGTTSTGSTGAGSGSGASAGSTTVTGPIIRTRYGNVQVQITVTNGKLSDVEAIQLPFGGQSGAISDYVAPILRSEALTVKSANIDLVSGATYTSTGYARSLQAALDKAHV